LEIKQLETIHTVLEQGSFLKAAEALGYVQSAITLHIQQLEKEVGFKLFEKQGRRMILTSEGRAFWEHARHLIDQMNALKETAAEISGGQIGHVRLGTIETVGKNILPPVLIDFFKKHPKMKLSLEFGGMKSISYGL
jgi:DNA-binding transcriptional LysR family regulator